MRHFYKVAVAEVTDGDTARLTVDYGFEATQRHKMRLWGINAPEKKFETGKRSRSWLINYLKSLTDSGSRLFVHTIEVKDQQIRDKYGRYLAILFDSEDVDRKEVAKCVDARRLPPGSINKVIVDNGYAVERYYE
jgi:endonuclease YncB( thermonuclease family)